MKVDKDTFKKIIAWLDEADRQLTQLDSMGFDYSKSILMECYNNLVQQLCKLAFGTKASEAIFTFIHNEMASPFSSIEELYDFVVDEYIEYIGEEALPLTALMKKLDNSPMIQSFYKFISEHNDSKSLDTEGK